ncbi:MAG: 3-hydroxybutyryl-CoA dehydratase [Thermoleophilaceae bacterium]|jgi:acyl dehydratase|nr:3-hydroxybutyryl-CoA dehydratase [Thermoleophilaceae bacterium]
MSTYNWSRPFDELVEGEEFATDPRVIGERDVLLFAALTGDHHPAHVDGQWAARGPFGEQVAHGMLVLSFAVGMVPFDPQQVVALRRISDVVFKRPVKLGDVIRVEGKLESKKAMSDEAGLACWSWTIADARGSNPPACRAKVDVLWRRSDPDANYDPFSGDHHGFLPIPL